MRQSPFNQQNKIAEVVIPTQLKTETSPLANIKLPSTSGHSLAALSNNMLDQKIDEFANDIAGKANATTEKILNQMNLVRFDELGTILADVEMQVSSLDPKKFERSGISGWLKNKFSDVKKEFNVRYKKASSAFDDLGKQIANHIAIHTNWITNLQSLYDENFKQYEDIKAAIERGEQMKALVQQMISEVQILENDPDAAFKLNTIQVYQSRLNRITIKIDSLMRHKVITENNGPKILNQIETSRNTIYVLRDVVDSTIPIIKNEFVLFQQSLESAKSIGVVNKARDLANLSLRRSAESGTESAKQAALTLNTATVSNDTLDLIRSKTFEMIQSVKTIEKQAQQQRILDEQSMKKSQEEYLAKLKTVSGV